MFKLKKVFRGEPLDSQKGKIYLFSIEECILELKRIQKNKEFLNKPEIEYSNDSLICANHQNSYLLIEKLTPDIAFLDLNDEKIVSPEHIRRGNLVGRGAFGFVFNGFIKQRV